ncbi:MAG: type IV pilus modification protein PilV [Methylococcales bacterium]
MKKNTGFTLIEVLISMLILAVGLLGLAALQANGLKNNVSAYNRSQATQLAYDIADRMRTNMADAGTLAASTYIYTTENPIATVAVQNDCKQVANTCTTAQMAQNDLFEWNTDINNLLPLGSGDIAVVGSIFTVTINWDDNRDGNVDTTNDPSFQMSFQL